MIVSFAYSRRVDTVRIDGEIVRNVVLADTDAGYVYVLSRHPEHGGFYVGEDGALAIDRREGSVTIEIGPALPIDWINDDGSIKLSETTFASMANL